MTGRVALLGLAVFGAAIVAEHELAAQPQAPPLIDWSTDGGDVQRTGWVRDEKILTKDNVKSLKMSWKRETGNEPRALHSLMNTTNTISTATLKTKPSTAA